MPEEVVRRDSSAIEAKEDVQIEPENQTCIDNLSKLF